MLDAQEFKYDFHLLDEDMKKNNHHNDKIKNGMMKQHGPQQREE